MRVHLEEWLLGDGQLPDPEVGATLYGVAILVRCESSSLSSGVDEVVAAPKPDEDPTSSSRVTLDGTVVWRDDGAIAAVIRVGDRLIALETEHRDYPSDWDPEVGDWDDVVRTTIDVPTAEERVRVVGNAAVMPEHELEDGYLLTDPWTTEIQDTWDVVGITLVEHGPFGVGVVASKPVDRAESWTHVDQPVSYVLDLEPSATAYDRAKAAADAPWNAARVVDYLVRRSPRLRTYDADPDPETRLRSVVTSLVADLDGPLRRPRLRALDRALRRADHATAWIVTETLGTEVFKGRPPSEWTAAMRGWPRSVVDRMVLVVEVLELQGDGYDDPTERGFTVFTATVDGLRESHAGKPWREVRAALDDALHPVVRRPVTWFAPHWAEVTARDIADPGWRTRHPVRAWRLRRNDLFFAG